MRLRLSGTAGSLGSAAERDDVSDVSCVARCALRVVRCAFS